MADSRLPDREEINELRSRGVVAASPYLSSLIAAFGMLAFIFNSGCKENIESLLSAETIIDIFHTQAMQSLLSTTVVAILVYTAVYIFISLLQTRFYFSLYAAFRRSEAIFSLSRAFSFFSFSALLGNLGVLLVTGLLAFCWYESVNGLPLQIQSFNYDELLDTIRYLARRLVLFSVLLAVLSALLVYLYARIRFLVTNRVALKRR